MKRSIILITMVSVLIAGTALAFPGHRGAMARGHGGCMGPGHDGDHIGSRILLHHADEIGLTEAQKTEIISMMEKFGAERIEKEAALEKAQLKMRTLHLQDGSDDQILGMMDEIAQIKLELRKMQFKHRRAVEAKLTDEQKAKIKEIHQEMMKKRMRDCRGDGPRQGMGMGTGQGRGFGR